MVESNSDPLQIQLAGLDLGEVEDVVDDAEQMLGRTLDLADIVELLRIEPGLQGEMGHAEGWRSWGCGSVAPCWRENRSWPGCASAAQATSSSWFLACITANSSSWSVLRELLLHLLQQQFIGPQGRR